MQYTNDGKFRVEVTLDVGDLAVAHELNGRGDLTEAEIVEAAAVVKILERIGRRMNPCEVFEQIAGNPNVDGDELDNLYDAAGSVCPPRQQVA
ncbi:MAG: hypothetical protein HLUCCO18_07580 [Rhodobacteraceae bacterium HLUCCO18]|nr:MAG: hypothetical protein HLUCCO18_07580 [Rhodobacteraceae bacterium HLUCCO18]